MYIYLRNKNLPTIWPTRHEHLAHTFCSLAQATQFIILTNQCWIQNYSFNSDNSHGKIKPKRHHICAFYLFKKQRKTCFLKLNQANITNPCKDCGKLDELPFLNIVDCKQTKFKTQSNCFPSFPSTKKSEVNHPKMNPIQQSWFTILSTHILGERIAIIQN